jgi:hypothetical protein
VGVAPPGERVENQGRAVVGALPQPRIQAGAIALWPTTHPRPLPAGEGSAPVFNAISTPARDGDTDRRNPHPRDLDRR